MLVKISEVTEDFIKAINYIKQATGEATYSKAGLAAIMTYKTMREEIKELEKRKDEAECRAENLENKIKEVKRSIKFLSEL